MELGDKQPSQLVSEVRRRLSEITLKADDKIIKSRLLTSLPTSLRSALVGYEDTNIEQYAKITDSMMVVEDFSSPIKTVNAVLMAGKEMKDIRYGRENHISKQIFHSI